MDKPVLYNLKNSLKVCFLPYPGVDSVTLHLRGLAGSNFENSSQIGASHILEHLSFNIGNKQKILLQGGKIIGVTSRDDVLYMVKTLKENVLDSIEFLSQIFKKNEFCKSDFENQKNVVTQEIIRVKGSPEKLISRASYKILYPKQRLSKFNTGEENDLKALKIEEVYSFKDTKYFPNNFVLVISGDVNHNNIFPYIEKYFGDYPVGQKTSHLSHKQNSKKEIQIIHIPVKQTHVKIDFYGYEIRNDKKYGSAVLALALDLYLKNLIREKLGLVYNINCNSFSTGSYGLFSVYFACGREKSEELINMVLETIKESKKILSTRNLEHVKKITLANMIYGFEKTSVRADYYSELLLHGMPYQNHLYEMGKIKNLSINAVKEIANEINNQKPKITIITML